MIENQQHWREMFSRVNFFNQKRDRIHGRGGGELRVRRICLGRYCYTCVCLVQLTTCKRDLLRRICLGRYCPTSSPPLQAPLSLSFLSTTSFPDPLLSLCPPPPSPPNSYNLLRGVSIPSVGISIAGHLFCITAHTSQRKRERHTQTATETERETERETETEIACDRVR